MKTKYLINGEEYTQDSFVTEVRRLINNDICLYLNIENTNFSLNDAFISYIGYYDNNLMIKICETYPPTFYTFYDNMFEIGCARFFYNGSLTIHIKDIHHTI